MVPTYPQGKIILGWRFGKVREGDVVIARHHKYELIKRVMRLKNNKVYLIGDNPDGSTDSRHWGWLPVQSIVAVVLGGRKAL